MTLLLHLLLLTTPVATAPERIAVLAVHDPPAPDGELTELTHQLRAASVERLAGVLTAPELRDRLAGKTGGATAQELDRAFGGALAVYQAGEADSAARTLRAIVEDLEELPEGEAVWGQWTRAMLRLSHVYLSLRQEEARDAVQVALLKVDPGHQLDPVLYAPGFRAHFEALRQKVRAMPKRRLTVTARGRGGTIYVSGRDVGPTPATVILPAGTYRVAGAAGSLRIPAFEVDLSTEDRSVVLDFALAEAFRPGAGPGMVLPAAAERAASIIRAGAWLGVEKLVVASRGSEGGAHFLVGAIYDVRRGALLREGSVRMISGGVPATNLGALAAFLLTGQSSREVQDRTREPQGRAAPRPVPAPAPSAAGGPPLVAATAPGPTAAAPGAAAAAPAPQVTFIPAARAGKAGPSVPAPPPPQAPSTAPALAALTAPAPAATPPLPSTAPPAAAHGAAPIAPRPSRIRAQAVHPAEGPAPAPAPPAPAADLRPAPPAEDPVALAFATPPPVDVPPRPRWVRPAVIGAGVLAAGLTALAAHQGVSAHRAYGDADAMVLPSGAFIAPYTRTDHAAALARGDAANRNAWLAGAGAVATAATGALLHWRFGD